MLGHAVRYQGRGCRGAGKGIVDLNGFIVIDKPRGFTSFDVVAKLRGAFMQKRIGHGGTLDPMATGVLPVFLGNATRAADILPDTKKRYVATAKFGILTETGDVTGAVIEKNEAVCSCAELERAMAAIFGKQSQVPPMYSALKIDGKRLYELAREGKTVERLSRSIEIFDIELLNFDEATREFTFDVTCSKGTYVRTLAEDIAKLCGLIATLTALRRTRSGPFLESSCIQLEEACRAACDGGAKSMLRPIEDAFLPYRDVFLTASEKKAYLNGVSFCRAEFSDGAEEETVRTFCGSCFLGTALITKDGTVKKQRQFFENT
ncbi:MAG: tRNA pseudouridine(55) synthase TruB [Oscillospiraceae bacterium]